MTPDEMADAIAALAHVALAKAGRSDLLALLKDPGSVKVVDSDDLDTLTLTIDGVHVWAGPAQAVTEAAAILRGQRDRAN